MQQTLGSLPVTACLFHDAYKALLVLQMFWITMGFISIVLAVYCPWCHGSPLSVAGLTRCQQHTDSAARNAQPRQHAGLLLEWLVCLLPASEVCSGSCGRAWAVAASRSRYGVTCPGVTLPESHPLRPCLVASVCSGPACKQQRPTCLLSTTTHVDVCIYRPAVQEASFTMLERLGISKEEFLAKIKSAARSGEDKVLSAFCAPAPSHPQCLPAPVSNGLQACIAWAVQHAPVSNGLQ